MTWFAFRPTDDEGRDRNYFNYFTTRWVAEAVAKKELGDVRVSEQEILVLADGKAYRLVEVENDEEQAKRGEGAKAKLTKAERRALGVK